LRTQQSMAGLHPGLAAGTAGRPVSGPMAPTQGAPTPPHTKAQATVQSGGLLQQICQAQRSPAQEVLAGGISIIAARSTLTELPETPTRRYANTIVCGPNALLLLNGILILAPTPSKRTSLLISPYNKSSLLVKRARCSLYLKFS